MSDADETLLEDLRPASFAIAYRMLGSVAEAEDVVQEALLRVMTALEQGTRIDSPRAFMATVTTRLAIDELRSARARRELYVGEWLPEPVLRPGDLAGLPRRARQGRPRFDALREQRDELGRRFFAAAQDGELEALQALLADDVVLHGDGGGKVPALARALHGNKRVAHTLVVWTRQMKRLAGATLRPVDVNGQPGAMLLDGEGRLIAVWALDITDGLVVVPS